jgi:hypothetical protein
MLRQSAFFQN